MLASRIRGLLKIMGWSTSTAIRMTKEVYGHISLATRLRAIEQVEAFMLAQKQSDPAQNPTQLDVAQNIHDSVGA